MDSIHQNLQSYNRELQNRKLDTKAKNYLQSIVEKYEPFICWDNSTLRKDRAIFYMTAARFYQRRTPAQLTQLLEWVKSKNCLHPLQVVKLLNKN